MLWLVLSALALRAEGGFQVAVTALPWYEHRKHLLVKPEHSQEYCQQCLLFRCILKKPFLAFLPDRFVLHSGHLPCPL